MSVLGEDQVAIRIKVRVRDRFPGFGSAHTPVARWNTMIRQAFSNPIRLSDRELLEQVGQYCADHDVDDVADQDLAEGDGQVEVHEALQDCKR